MRRGLLIVGVIGSLAVVSAMAHKFDIFPDSQQVFPLNRISFQGDFIHLNQPDLNQRIADIYGSNFVNVSLKEIKVLIENHPWVKAASVRRVWPDRVHVDIEERKPLARWNDSGFIDYDGEVVELDVADLPRSLVKLRGPHYKAAEIANRYRAINNVLRAGGVGIDSLILDERRAWKVILDDGIQVSLGTVNFDKRVRLMADLYARLKTLDVELEAVDLRYTNGFSIRETKTSNVLSDHGLNKG